MLAFIGQDIEYKSNSYTKCWLGCAWSIVHGPGHHTAGKMGLSLKGAGKMHKNVVSTGELEWDWLCQFYLELQRLRGDMIRVYNIGKGIAMVDSQCLFPIVEMSTTREQRFKVRGRKFKGNLNGNYFTQIVGIWNELPEEMVEAGTETTFNKHLQFFE